MEGRQVGAVTTGQNRRGLGLWALLEEVELVAGAAIGAQWPAEKIQSPHCWPSSRACLSMSFPKPLPE